MFLLTLLGLHIHPVATFEVKKPTIVAELKVTKPTVVATWYVSNTENYNPQGGSMKTINCIISKDNPYENMPMVCKVVLQKPQQ